MTRSVCARSLLKSMKLKTPGAIYIRAVNSHKLRAGNHSTGRMVPRAIVLLLISFDTDVSVSH